MHYSLAYIWSSAGIFSYPLLLCSVVVVYVAIERTIALRDHKIIPAALLDTFFQGSIESDHLLSPIIMRSVGGRILDFFRKNNPDAEALKAFSQWQLTRLERGLFLLEIVISGAPLIGLLGTVTGLIALFSNVSEHTGLPSPELLVESIALALTTTMLGLAIAIPTIAIHGYIMRKVEVLSAQIQVGVERLISLSVHSKKDQ